MKQKLYIFSLIGWSVSTLIVTTTFFETDLLKIFPILWTLFVGVFIAFAPALFYAKNNSKISDFEYENNSFNSGIPLIPFIENAPNWILGIIGLSFIVAIVFFSKLFNSNEASNFILTRGFFGMAMLFYSIAILIYKRLIEWEDSEFE